jgi:predicted DNA-binding protein YlxM (UPF0122 family)
LLENYEVKLHLYDDYQHRQQAAEHLNTYIQKKYPNDEKLIRLATQLVTLEEE